MIYVKPSSFILVVLSFCFCGRSFSEETPGDKSKAKQIVAIPDHKPREIPAPYGSGRYRVDSENIFAPGNLPPNEYDTEFGVGPIYDGHANHLRPANETAGKTSKLIFDHFFDKEFGAFVKPKSNPVHLEFLSQQKDGKGNRIEVDHRLMSRDRDDWHAITNRIENKLRWKDESSALKDIQGLVNRVCEKSKIEELLSRAETTANKILAIPDGLLSEDDRAQLKYLDYLKQAIKDRKEREN